MPVRLHKYIITLRHDSGGFVLSLKARNKKSARQLVRLAEGCPDRAILSINRAPKRK